MTATLPSFSLLEIRVLGVRAESSVPCRTAIRLRATRYPPLQLEAS